MVRVARMAKVALVAIQIEQNNNPLGITILVEDMIIIYQNHGCIGHILPSVLLFRIFSVNIKTAHNLSISHYKL